MKLGMYFQNEGQLTLIGMREGTFHPLSFMDQILSAEFSSKFSKLFWRRKLTSIGLIDTMQSSFLTKIQNRISEKFFKVVEFPSDF
jgi:hypothetical protein